MLFKKLTIIKGLVFVVIIAALISLGWAIPKKLKEEKKFTEKKPPVSPVKKEEIKKEIITKEEKATSTQPQVFVPKQDLSKLKIEEITIEPFDVSNWKVYRNEEYGFEIRYPKEGRITIRDITEETGGERKPKTGKGILFVEIDPEGDTREEEFNLYQPSWEGENFERLEDDIETLIFPSIEALRVDFVEYMEWHGIGDMIADQFEGKTFRELMQKVNNIEDFLQLNIIDYRFDKQYPELDLEKGKIGKVVYVRKFKIGNNVGYQFVDQSYFLTPTRWRARPYNYCLMFSPPNNKIYWFHIDYLDKENSPRMKIFFQILSTLNFF
jgi:hypothetical protein